LTFVEQTCINLVNFLNFYPIKALFKSVQNKEK